jgi:hypothetical protein
VKFILENIITIGEKHRKLKVRKLSMETLKESILLEIKKIGYW